MAQTKNSPYVNGVFIKEEQGQFGPYLSIGITEDGLKALNAAAPNGKGVRNFIAGRQKNDESKFSLKPSTPKGGNDNGQDTLPF